MLSRLKLRYHAAEAGWYLRFHTALGRVLLAVTHGIVMYGKQVRCSTTIAAAFEMMCHSRSIEVSVTFKFMNRRSFLQRAFGGAVVSLSTARFGLRGSSSANRRLSKIGLQLYTVRKELEKDFAGTLEKVAALGFLEVELFQTHAAGDQDYSRSLQTVRVVRSHLNCSAARQFAGGDRGAQAIRHRYLVCGYVPAEERTSLDDYKVFETT